ncbi:hypothetical protein [Natronosalvus halobius]|uniref:phage NrS-1 polymerase family protein n=1 Tax=Natronosalvus halobius TaxID=2953746 RepID=UPI0020A05E31|nr:hypothetical protein [Natronosalvus halobius]USZ71425.1 hypothetical protein NGM15_15310 [Natronosalvus halobius]
MLTAPWVTVSEITPSQTEKMIEGSIPEKLRARDQWLCWRSEDRDGKSTKVPIDPKTGSFASSTDNTTWSDFDSVLTYSQSGIADGIGFVFTPDDPFVGIDLDDCRDPETGRPDTEIKSIVQQLDSYTEVSPSGTGYHVLVEGTLPSGRNRRGQIELYDHARYFTVTGDRVPGLPTEIEHRQAELEEIHREYVERDSSGDGNSSARAERRKSRLTLSDEELLEKARAASNNEKFERLWNGSTVGYDSHSEADMALCCLLAFWTGGNQNQMDRLFRQSGLVRPKWDAVHYGDGTTYGKRTLERAVEHTTEYYESGAQEEATAKGRSRGTSESTRVRTENDREMYYLARKNEILEKQVRNLEEALEEKNQRISELKVTIEDRENEHTRKTNISTGKIDKSDSTPTPSLWKRLRRLVIHRDK